MSAEIWYVWVVSVTWRSRLRRKIRFKALQALACITTLDAIIDVDDNFIVLIKDVMCNKLLYTVNSGDDYCIFRILGTSGEGVLKFF